MFCLCALSRESFSFLFFLPSLFFLFFSQRKSRLCLIAKRWNESSTVEFYISVIDDSKKRAFERVWVKIFSNSIFPFHLLMRPTDMYAIPEKRLFFLFLGAEAEELQPRFVEIKDVQSSKSCWCQGLWLNQLFEVLICDSFPGLCDDDKLNSHQCERKNFNEILLKIEKNRHTNNAIEATASIVQLKLTLLRESFSSRLLLVVVLFLSAAHVAQVLVPFHIVAS